MAAKGHRYALSAHSNNMPARITPSELKARVTETPRKVASHVTQPITARVRTKSQANIQLLPSVDISTVTQPARPRLRTKSVTDPGSIPQIRASPRPASPALSIRTRTSSPASTPPVPPLPTNKFTFPKQLTPLDEGIRSPPVKAKITSGVSNSPRTPVGHQEPKRIKIPASTTPLRSPTLSPNPISTPVAQTSKPAKVNLHARSGSSSSVSTASKPILRQRTNSSAANSKASGEILASPGPPDWLHNARDLERAREMETEARDRRKILDLEITNASLLSINAMLERTKQKQTTEIRDLRRQLREGNHVIAPLSPSKLADPIQDEDDTEQTWALLLEDDPEFGQVARCLEQLISQGVTALSTQDSVRFKGGTRVLMPSFDAELAGGPPSDQSGRTSPLQLHDRVGLGLTHIRPSLAAFDLGSSTSTQSSEAEAWSAGIVSPASMALRSADRSAISPSPRMYGLSTPEQQTPRQSYAR